jgi:glycosyltransferase involved in cell wall biosynthesis
MLFHANSDGDPTTEHSVSSQKPTHPVSREGRKTMRWLVLATHIGRTGAGGGMIRYAVEMIRNLNQFEAIDVHVLCTKDGAQFFQTELGFNSKQIHIAPTMPVIGLSLLERYSLHPVFAQKWDVIQGAKHLLPRFVRKTTKTLLTAHDTLPLDRPTDFTTLKRTLLRNQYLESLREADGVVCVSEATRSRVRSYVPSVQKKSTVTRLAVSDILRTVNPEPIRELINRRFALVVGDASPRKNLAFVGRCWTGVIERDPEAVLAIVGPKGWGTNEGFAELQNLVTKGRAVLLGHVSNAELRWAYEHASVTLCPSLLEGFGLPVAEALAAGSPVVSSTDPAQMEAGATILNSMPGAWIRHLSVTNPEPWIHEICERLQTPRVHTRPVTAIGAEPSLTVAARRTWADVAGETAEFAQQTFRELPAQKPGISDSGATPRAVLHVAQPTTGGVADYVAAVALVQQQRSWPVHIAGGTELVDRPSLVASNIPTSRWNANRSPVKGILGEVKQLRAIVEAVQPEVVVLHSAKAALIGRLVLRRRIPTIVVPHAWSFLAVDAPLSWLVLLWERVAARWTNAVVCVSSHEVDLAVSEKIRAPMFLVENPVIEKQNSVDSSGSTRATQGDPMTVVCVGRWCRQKGQDILLQAWPLVRSAHPGAKLIFVGDTDESNRTAGDGEGSGARNGIEFVGWQQDTRPWLRTANVVVVPSRWEGLSLAMLEALDESRSVVITNVGGSEVIQAADAGAVVSSDPLAIATALNTRLSNPQLSSAEGARGKAWITRHHSLDGAVDKLNSLLSRIESFG